MKVIPISSAPGFRTMAAEGGKARQLILPVAPRANAKLRFAVADAPPPAMSPAEALAWVTEVVDCGENLAKVIIDGPGDPLAVIGPTLETLRLLRRSDGSLPLELVTLGLCGEQYAQLLMAEGVGLVTMLVDAVDPEIIASLYAWIRPGRKTVPLGEAAVMLAEEQAMALAAFRKAGIQVRVRTTLYPGINDEHLEKLACRMAELGVTTMSLMGFRPQGEAADGVQLPPEPDGAMLEAACRQMAKFLEVKKETLPGETAPALAVAGGGSSALPKPGKERPNVAVVSSNGMEVDLHLGQAIQVLIYGPREDGLACLLERRPLPEPGGGGLRWQRVAESLPDCFALLTASAGENPRKILRENGISVLITGGEITGSVDVLYGGGKKKKNK